MKELTQGEFDAAVANSDVPVVVDFWAPWCGPCRMAMPKVEALSRELGEMARFYKVNVDAEGALAQRLQIKGIPAFRVYYKGEQVAALANDLAGLRRALDELTGQGA